MLPASAAKARRGTLALRRATIYIAVMSDVTLQEVMRAVERMGAGQQTMQQAIERVSATVERLSAEQQTMQQVIERLSAEQQATQQAVERLSAEQQTTQQAVERLSADQQLTRRGLGDLMGRVDQLHAESIANRAAMMARMDRLQQGHDQLRDESTVNYGAVVRAENRIETGLSRLRDDVQPLVDKVDSFVTDQRTMMSMARRHDARLTSLEMDRTEREAGRQ